MDEKNKQKISELDELRLIYFEIINGGSFNASSGLFVKHFSEKESFLILKKKIELFKFYSSEGVPHEEELLKRALENEDWTQEKEDKILELKYLLSDNEKNLHNIIPEQRGGIEAILAGKRNELCDIQQERKANLGRCVEDLVDDDISDYLSYLSFFKDEKFSVPFVVNYEEYQNLEPTELTNLTKCLNEEYNRFNEENIKKIACLPFFLNKFSYTKDNISNFIGVPVNSFTHNQNALFSLGVRNLNTSANTKGHPPDISLDARPIDVVKWYDIQHSILIGKQNQSKT